MNTLESWFLSVVGMLILFFLAWKVCQWLEMPQEKPEISSEQKKMNELRSFKNPNYYRLEHKEEKK